ncbi:MAG: contractile injection system protein, VgrG/Pvc8 family [Gammaproteobacteria bacterium]
MSEAFANARPTLRLAGEERSDLAEVLLTALATLPLAGMASAEVHCVNWAQSSAGGGADFAFLDVALGDRLELSMGADSSSIVFDGEITGIEERYGDGAPRIVFLAEDRLHRLARRRRSRSFEDRSVDDIARELAADAGLQADVNLSGAGGTYHQINESDLAFLLRLASRFDVAPRLDNGRLRARAEQADASPIVLDVQTNVQELRLLADLNHQAHTTTVRGYNAATDQNVSASAHRVAAMAGGSTAADILDTLGWPGEDLAPVPFPLTQSDADAAAASHHRGRARRFIHGDVVCDGQAQLASGREVDLRGVSPRLRGKYRVVHCAHRFDTRSGYQSELRLSRPDWGS